MKFVKISPSLLLINVLLGGCGGDPPPGPDPAAMLVGTWENTRYVATGCVDPGDNENTTCSSNCEILVITATTLTVVGEGQHAYTTSGNSLSINFGAGPEILEFAASDKELTFTHQATPDKGGCKSVSTYKRQDGTVTDADGNTYNTIFIGQQQWTKENLRTTRYSNGAEIPNVTDTQLWTLAFQGAYADYDNNASNVQIYGRLYNSYAASDPSNICPIGWHVATYDDWNVLFATLGGASVAGGKMKSTSGQWTPPNQGATNESDFSALPSGTRFDAGDFRDLHSFAHFRSSDGATFRLQADNTAVELYYNYVTNGSAVRCVKNQ